MESCGSVPPDPGSVVATPPAAETPAAPAAQAPTAPLPYEGVWRFTAPALDSSVPQARHAIRALLRNQRVPVHAETVDTLLLIASELVTNAVRHAAVLSPEIMMEVSVSAAWIRVGVEDKHPYRPKALVADQGWTRGRGLLIVKAITAEVGGMCDVEKTANGGKVIWAALPLAAPAGLSG
jgi:anti-sigma regulatory factor (Ser/Thr protein kinase)